MEGQQGRADPRPGALGGMRPGGQANHEMVVKGREQATISGVVHVASFDDHEIVLDTDLGTLTILGHDLHIKQLDLAKGTFWVEGLIDSATYGAPGKGRRRGGDRRAAGGGMFRLFR